ncbi:transferase [Lithospermum erythrorhizon]|uniref:Sulfotransferase n=1 Tax=Lithospermum erythrorhizon TaxID=34254 RepID=A0AAV3RYR2_LITER
MSLKNSVKVLFMTYEELQWEPSVLVRRLADFLGYSISAEEEDAGMVEAIVKLCSFQSLTSLEVHSSASTKLITRVENKVLFRKGGVGDWKNDLSVEMATQIDMITEQKFQGSGLLEHNSRTFSKSIP